MRLIVRSAMSRWKRSCRRELFVIISRRENVNNKCNLNYQPVNKTRVHNILEYLTSMFTEVWKKHSNLKRFLNALKLLNIFVFMHHVAVKFFELTFVSQCPQVSCPQKSSLNYRDFLGLVTFFLKSQSYSKKISRYPSFQDEEYIQG